MVAADRGGHAVMPDGIRPVAHVGDAPDLWLLAAAFTGSLCLFLLELFAGKFLLPRFGGAPAVWVSCLAFFQVALIPQCRTTRCSGLAIKSGGVDNPLVASR